MLLPLGRSGSVSFIHSLDMYSLSCFCLPGTIPSVDTGINQTHTSLCPRELTVREGGSEETMRDRMQKLNCLLGEHKESDRDRAWLRVPIRLAVGQSFLEKLAGE